MMKALCGEESSPLLAGGCSVFVWVVKCHFSVKSCGFSLPDVAVVGAGVGRDTKAVAPSRGSMVER